MENKKVNAEVMCLQAEFSLTVGKGKHSPQYGFLDDEYGTIEYLNNDYIFGWKIYDIGSETSNFLKFYGAFTSKDNTYQDVSIIFNDTETYIGKWQQYGWDCVIQLNNNKSFREILSPYYNQKINIKIIISDPEVRRASNNLSCYFIYTYPDTYKSITDIQPYIKEINDLAPACLNRIFEGTGITDIDLTGLDYSTL